MEKFSYELKIPKERVAVLIGKKGEVKQKIGEGTKTRLKIDSEEGAVFISGTDALGLFVAREIVRAIGRGFSPECALLLLKPDFMFDIVDIGEFAKSKESMRRLKGRVIGKEGKSRRIIEEMTGTYISVYGKTIGIIGESEGVETARQAVISILRGSRHANVYKWLEKRRTRLKYG